MRFDTHILRNPRAYGLCPARVLMLLAVLLPMHGSFGRHPGSAIVKTEAVVTILRHRRSHRYPGSMEEGGGGGDNTSHTMHNEVSVRTPVADICSQVPGFLAYEKILLCSAPPQTADAGPAAPTFPAGG